ncbi:MAG TPA: ABC transporter ATP-binding protein [Steroidobacteraceae bacterium]|nr:ABC transporter ATP-binding protein [Steroidobacteraceae bacterium]
MPHTALECRDLDVQVAGRMLVRGLALVARPGSFIAILGENGVGKTLTLHSLAGLRTPAKGAVLLEERLLHEWPRRARARRLALLAQSDEDPFPSTVLETALVGRHPHLGLWDWESRTDVEIARHALADVDLADFDLREVGTLSGGERRRLAIATVLVQAPAVYLLDEPTNHLDPHHAVDTLKLFRRRVDAGACVIASLHDANQAERFADQVLLLESTGAWQFGPTRDVVSAESLTRIYRTPIAQLQAGKRRVFIDA